MASRYLHKEPDIRILNETCHTCGGEEEPGLQLITVPGGKQCRSCIGRPLNGDGQ